MPLTPPPARRPGDSTDRSHAAVVCAGGGNTRLETRTLSPPRPGEMLIRLRCAGVCGTDLFKLDNNTAAVGSVLGHEIVGEVFEMGDADLPFEPGDRVVVPHHVPCGDCVYCQRDSETMCPEFRTNLLDPGGFAELVRVLPRALESGAARRIPEKVSDDAAVFMEPAACVLRGVRRAGLFESGVAIIQGAGSMGLLHVLVLAALRPGITILVVDPLDSRRELSKRLGANQAVPPGDAAESMTRELSRGVGADAVFDTVGGPALLDAALGLLRPGGTAVLFAHSAEGSQAQFDLNELFKHEKRVIGSYSGTLQEQADVFDAIVSGSLDPRPLISHRMSLGDFDSAVDLLRRREALKVILSPEDRQLKESK